MTDEQDVAIGHMSYEVRGVGELTAEGQAAAERARERYEPADGGVDGDVQGRLDALGYAD